MDVKIEETAADINKRKESMSDDEDSVEEKGRLIKEAKAKTYDEAGIEDVKEYKSAILPHENLLDLAIKPKKDKVAIKKRKRKQRGIFESIKYFILRIWKLSISTPFVLMLALRVYTIIWAAKYNSYFSIIIVFWNYYSICYTDHIFFHQVTSYFLLPAMAIQIIATKLIEIPHIIPSVIPSSRVKYLTLIGSFRYSLDKSIDANWEHIWTLGGLVLVCAVIKMMQYIPEYERWLKETNRQKTIPNNLEIAVHFCLDHTEKLYIILLYIMAFSKLNVIGTLLLFYLFSLMLCKTLARQWFIFVIIIMTIKALGTQMVVGGYIFFEEYKSEVSYGLKIFGIYMENREDKILYKADIEWEVILMYFCSFIQLKIFNYVIENPFEKIDINKESYFIKFAKTLNSIVQILLPWIIYLVFIILLVQQETTFLISGYIVIVVFLMGMHIGKSIGTTEFKGRSAYNIPWTILAIFSTFILLFSYVCNFVFYTGEHNRGYAESILQIIKIAGIDITKEEASKLQWALIPQFVILYLSFIARQNIAVRRSGPEKKRVMYKRKTWMLLIQFLDLLSQYNIHLVFIVIGCLAALWSVNFIMFLYLVIFGVHYISLHLSYLRVRRYKSSSGFNYYEKQLIINEEVKEQKELALSQRRFTVTFILSIALIALILTQGFALVQTFKMYFLLVFYSYIDRYVVDNYYLIACAEVLEVLGQFMGMAFIEPPKNSLLILMIGNVAVLYLCAIEAHSIEWYENRMGYTYVKEPTGELKDFSWMDLFKAMLTKIIISNARTIKYKMTMMLILKTLLEYAIIGSFLFSAAGKSNIQETIFIPVAFFCIIRKLSLSISWRIATYMWFWILLLYLLFVLNMTKDSVPQPISEIFFFHVFNITEWPIYNLLLGDSKASKEWARYFGLLNTSTTRYFLVFDVILLAIQGIYFHNFSHSFYTLSTSMISDKRSFVLSVVSVTSEKEGDFGEKPGWIMRTLYKSIKNVLLIYSHIFTLFCLIIMTSFSEGAINIFYLFFSVSFLQFELFANITGKKWRLPKYFKFVLKPYVFIDITLQFAYQIPYVYIWLERHKPILSFLGIRDVDINDFSLWIKAAIFTLVLYQESIYSSKEYKRVCGTQGMNIINLVSFNNNSRKPISKYA